MLSQLQLCPSPHILYASHVYLWHHLWNALTVYWQHMTLFYIIGFVTSYAHLHLYLHVHSLHAIWTWSLAFLPWPSYINYPCTGTLTFSIEIKVKEFSSWFYCVYVRVNQVSLTTSEDGHHAYHTHLLTSDDSSHGLPLKSRKYKETSFERHILPRGRPVQPGRNVDTR